MWKRAGRHAAQTLATALVLAGGCDRDSSKTSHAPPASQPAKAELIEAENRGVGLMGQFDFDAALQVFSDLAANHPILHDAQVNLAIATLNRQRETDSAQAMKLLDGVLAHQPDHLRARYCKAILLLNAAQPAAALKEFQFVAQADPTDAYAIYYQGQCFAALGQHDEALSAYRRASQLDPYLRSAHYGAFQSLQKLGRPDEAKTALAEFQKLKDNLQSRLVEFKYTRMGPKAEAFVSSAREEPPPTQTPAGPPFAEPVTLPLVGGTVPWRSADEQGIRPGITAADIDSDGHLDLFISSALASDALARNVVLLQRKGAFQIDVNHPLATVADVSAALWGDFDNDGLTDVYLCRRGPNQLWRQVKPNEWQDVTAATRTAGGDLDTIDGAMIDADHDGDLDLLFVNRDGPNELLNNDRNGTFRPIAAEAGIAGDGRGAIGVVVSDLDGDHDGDLIILKRDTPHEVYLNDRLWRYRKGDGFETFSRTLMTAAVAADSDADGQVELYSISDDALMRWTVREGVWQSERLNHVPDGGERVAVADVDGTGRLALLVSRGAGWMAVPLVVGAEPLFRSEQPAVKSWSAIVLDAATGPAVVGLPPGGPPVIWRAGSGRHPFLGLSLSGKDNLADQMRSNASGIGVHLAARVGAHWTALETYRLQSGPGQSMQPVTFGLGGAKDADFVRLTWPDGLRQTELDLEAGRTHRVEETQRQTSSCPVIFAWDGQRYAFVTDCLGVGGIGFAVGFGEYAPPRPWENVLLPEGLLQPLEGRYHIKLGEPMEEACYLDSASLVRYDLPPGWSMTLDERMAVNDPQPTGEPRFYRRAMAPTSALNDRAQDVNHLISSADAKAAPPGEVDPRFIGLTREHTLTLTFPRPIDESGGEPMLVADGWVEYPYSQTMFSAWQAGAAYEAPTLEARDSNGEWVVVLKQFGYPAGMPRQMSVPLPREKLPPGTTMLRLRSTQEIYWDRLAVAWAEPCPQAKWTVLDRKLAHLAEVGFAARTTGPQRRPSYDHARRQPLWDARHQDGFYTAFGPVDELLGATDDALAIFGPGEEVHLEFAAPTDSLPSGWTRRLSLELAGWCKDKDLYTKDGETLEPLPHRELSGTDALGARDRMHERFNTRYRSGG